MLKRILWMVGIAALFWAGLYNQPVYPRTWFDEGLVLQGAINLAEYGRYAMRSSEGFRVLDQPLIANGPGLILPLSLVFRFFGAGLMQARILMAGCFVLAVVLFFRVSSMLSSPLAAFVSVLILLAVPAEGFILIGRQALGNVPAFIYFLGGILLLHGTAKRKSVPSAILSGALFGLTVVTKGQYWLALVTLGIAFLADLFHYRQIALRHWLIILLIATGFLFLWQYIQYLLVGSENYARHLDAIKSSARVTVFAFRPMRIPGNVWYLIRTGFPAFILPGVIYAGWKAREPTESGFVRFLLVAFTMIWLVWYSFASVGWSRYAFEAYTAGALLSGEGMMRLAGWVRTRFGTGLCCSYSEGVGGAAAVVFLIVAVLWGGRGLLGQIRTLAAYSDRSPLMLAKYIREQIPASAIIESWEWEIDALTPGFTYHHPANAWVDQKTAETQFGEFSGESYSPLIYHPEYLIDGPFSKFTNLYSTEISGGCCTKVLEIGNYTLYQVEARGN